MFPLLVIAACVFACAMTDGPAVTAILMGMLLLGWVFRDESFGRS